MKFEGFVKKISTKSGTGKRGAWTAYSAKLEKADGTEYEQWVGLGFDSPSFKEGDYVQLDTKEENGRQQLVKGSVKVKKNPPARASASSQPSGKAAASGSSTGTGYNDPARQMSITYQSSRKDAIEIVKLLLANEALPLTSTKGKAGTAKRFEEITLAVEKLTVELLNDVNTLRVIERVADAGLVKADKGAKNDLPEDASNEEEESDQDPSSGEDDNWEDE